MIQVDNHLAMIVSKCKPRTVHGDELAHFHKRLIRNKL